MAGSTLVLESSIDGIALVVTEAANEGVHVQMVEESTQDRNAPNSVLVHKWERIGNRTDDRFWMCLEVVVQLSCYGLPVGTLGISLLIERRLDWRKWRRGPG